MNVGGAYGGGKAGASFDLITFVQRPQVILRGCCWVSVSFSILSILCIINCVYIEMCHYTIMCAIHTHISAHFFLRNLFVVTVVGHS